MHACELRLRACEAAMDADPRRAPMANDDVPRPNAALRRKLDAAMEPIVEGSQLLDALRALNPLLEQEENTPAFRRGLRGKLERRSLAAAHELVAAFGELDGMLQAAGSEVESLTSASAALSSQLHRSAASTDELLAQTSSLRDELAAAERKAALASQFARAYELAPEAEDLLNSPPSSEAASAERGLEAILGALARVRQV